MSTGDLEQTLEGLMYVVQRVKDETLQGVREADALASRLAATKEVGVWVFVVCVRVRGSVCVCVCV